MCLNTLTDRSIVSNSGILSTNHLKSNHVNIFNKEFKVPICEAKDNLFDFSEID